MQTTSNPRPPGLISKSSLKPLIWLLNFDYWTIGNPADKMIFVYVLIYMDFISELPFFTQNFVQISAASHCHSGEVWKYRVPTTFVQRQGSVTVPEIPAHRLSSQIGCWVSCVSKCLCTIAQQTAYQNVLSRYINDRSHVSIKRPFF